MLVGKYHHSFSCIGLSPLCKSMRWPTYNATQDAERERLWGCLNGSHVCLRTNRTDPPQREGNLPLRSWFCRCPRWPWWCTAARASPARTDTPAPAATSGCVCSSKDACQEVHVHSDLTVEFMCDEILFLKVFLSRGVSHTIDTKPETQESLSTK